MIHDINKNFLKLENIAHLEDKLSIKQQIQLVKVISGDNQGLLKLFELLMNRSTCSNTKVSYLDGLIFKSLYNCKVDTLKVKLIRNFREGLVSLKSNNDIDYFPLYIALVSNDFRQANELTQIYLKQLTKIEIEHERQWLYFTDIFNLPDDDLETMDTLWKIYSVGKFGFSIQRQIWLYNNKDWDKFWHTIGWKINKKNIRYPHEFTWDNTAPIGHLPLFNQIRGVQVLATLFQHPVWDIENKVSL